MKAKTNLIALAVLLVTFSFIAIPAAPIVPGYSYYSIYFYEDSVPVTYANPPVCEYVYINVIDTAGSYKTIDTSYLRGDSLIIRTSLSSEVILMDNISQPDYIIYPGNSSVTFERHGIYKAYQIEGRGMPEPLGTFRVYPGASTHPASPATGQQIELSLTFGQVWEGCPGSYTDNNYTVNGNTINLTYSETPPNPLCDLLIVDPPLEYGPDFTLSSLAAGTYYLVIEDSIQVCSLTVLNNITISGSAVIMQDPMIKMMAQPVAGAAIQAITAEECDTWYLINNAASVPDTFDAVTDASGMYEMDVSNTGGEYAVTARKNGYYPQTIYYDTYEQDPEFVNFELLDSSYSPYTDLAVTVTFNNTPVESAYVYICGGREPLICPMLDGPAKKQETVYITKSGRTDRNGELLLDSVSLNPYIDYIYSVSKYIDQQSYYQTGTIRLNYFGDNTLTVDLSAPGILEHASAMQAANPVSVFPNPVRANVTVSFPNPEKSASVSVYNIAGRLVNRFENIRNGSVYWNAAHTPSGIYLVKIKSGNRLYRKQLMKIK